jgi:DNA-directed RNA polymerase specialized sigma24 family protein
MQEEYIILQAQLPFLNSNEKRIFALCMEDGKDFQSIAEQEGMQIESVRSRVWQIRKKIKKGAANYMEELL